MATYQQGVLTTGIGSTVLGLVQSITKTTNVTLVQAKDENGATADAVQLDPTREVKIDFVFDTGQTIPDLSATRETPVTFTYDPEGVSGAGEVHLVTNIEDVEENEGYRKVTLTCTRYLENSIPAA